MLLFLISKNPAAAEKSPVRHSSLNLMLVLKLWEFSRTR